MCTSISAEMRSYYTNDALLYHMQFIIKLYLKTIAHITYTHVIYNLIIFLLECSVGGMYGVTHT